MDDGKTQKYKEMDDGKTQKYKKKTAKENVEIKKHIDKTKNLKIDTADHVSVSGSPDLNIQQETKSSDPSRATETKSESVSGGVNFKGKVSAHLKPSPDRATQPAINDTPTTSDTLGFEPYVKALARMVSHSNTMTPLTVGIYGPWGSGKTSFMGQVEKMVNALKNKDIKIKHVKFNAWKYDVQDELWAVLLQTIIFEIEKGLCWGQKWRLKLRNVWQKVNKFALIVNIIIILLLVILAVIAYNPSSLSPKYKAIIVALGLSWLTIIPSIVQIWKKIRLPLGIDVSGMFSSNRLPEKITTFREFETDFDKILNHYIGDNGRLIIYIDDLDRCSPNKVVDVLETINVFLNTEHCIFFLGIDYPKVVQAIEVKYKDHLEVKKLYGELPQKREEFGEDFLEKIIQLPIFIPKIEEDKTDKFIKKVLGYSETGQKGSNDEQKENLPELKNIELSDDTKKIIKIATKYIEPNPRNIKKFLNIFRFIHLLYFVNRPDFEDKGIIESAIPLWFLLNYKFKDEMLEIQKSNIDSTWDDLFSGFNGRYSMIKSLIARFRKEENMHNLLRFKGNIKHYFKLTQCI